MRRAMLLLLVVALSSAPVAASAQSAATLTGGALIPASYGGFVRLAAGADLPQKLAALRAFASGPADPSAVIDALVEAIFPGSTFSYANDIASWLGGEIVIGASDLDDYVALAATTNTALSDTFIQKLIVYLSGQGVQLTPAIHQGAIVYASETVSVASAHNYLIYGAPAAVNAVLDVAAGQADSVAETLGFQQVAVGLSSDAFITVYASGGALQATLADLSVDASPLLTDPAIEGMGVSLTLDAPSLRVDFALGWSQNVDGPVLNTVTAGSMVAQAIPQDALGFFASYDLRWPVRIGLYLFVAQTYFETTLNAIRANQPAPELPTKAVLQTQANGYLALANLTLTRQLGTAIDIEQNVLNWMSGEYAVAFLRNPAGLYENQRIPADVALLAQVIDRNATLNTVEVLSRLVGAQFGLAAVPVNVGGYDLRAVPDPATGGNLIVLGIVGDFLVVATGSGIEQIVNVTNGATPSLSSNVVWQQRAAQVDPATEGLLYFAVSDFVAYARSTLTGDLLSEFEAYNAPGLALYDYVLAAADMRDGGLWTLSVRIQAK